MDPKKKTILERCPSCDLTYLDAGFETIVWWVRVGVEPHVQGRVCGLYRMWGVPARTRT